jgi:hypothetical protein
MWGNPGPCFKNRTEAIDQALTSANSRGDIAYLIGRQFPE